MCSRPRRLQRNVCESGVQGWATHGAKTDINSHPHMSHNDKFSLVHNGIIENFQEIKTFLAGKGIINKSQTDTEVIVNLLAYYFEEVQNVYEALKKTTEQLKGTWGLGIVYVNEPNKIYCTRHGSPLLVGIEENMAMTQHRVAPEKATNKQP